MTTPIFTNEELNQIKSAGRDIKKVLKQLAIFKTGTPYLHVERAATPEDGVNLPCSKKDEYLAAGIKAISEGTICKFVPASGAASRMFKVLSTYIATNGKTDDISEPFLATFFDNLSNFAFYDELMEKCRGIEPKDTYTTEEKLVIVKALLNEDGLNYGSLPKAALKFHKYKNNPRTSIEEQLVEGALYTCDKDNLCRLSFTVSKEHLEGIQTLIESKLPLYEEKYGVNYKIDYSTQSAETDTIAVNPDNTPFRDKGEILFRPGGHGALIKNLNAIQSTYIVIKNIDNVSPDSMKNTTVFWKKVMTGIAATQMTQCHEHVKALLSKDCEKESLTKATSFLKSINTKLPPGFDDYSFDDTKRKLVEQLDRPLRVCGMVRNQGEPGGGPFWVKGNDGILSLQIVESSQIEPEERESLMASGTHFNPVDIVAAKARYDGSYFNLEEFTDENAVFISYKSKNGKELKALELPGLWNGAMANWNTIFVEVPIETFNPVKTVNDLLRPQHQC